MLKEVRGDILLTGAQAIAHSPHRCAIRLEVPASGGENGSDPSAREETPMSRKSDPRPRSLVEASTLIDRRAVVAAGAAALLPSAGFAQSLTAATDRGPRFRRVPTQFIAALAPRDATSGDNAGEWGIWRQDPGPRGVRLAQYERLMAAGGRAPAGWQFDSNGWWLEEHGLIMESPEFPMPAGQFMVTGNRAAKSVLTVEAPAADGSQHWSLDGGANIYDVTHLRCRSAVYTPGAGACSPTSARQSDFPVAPGAEMPAVAGCSKQDYAVLIVFGVAVENG